MTTKPCKDCLAEGITTRRVADYPGPRCHTHWRAEKKRRSLVRHGQHVEADFGIPARVYWALYEHQGGRCFVCRKSTGAARRLAVDHDHRCGAGHPPENGCPRCCRALICGPCNQMIGWLDVEALKRAIEVLADPPAQKFLRTLNELP